jgi:hypothetical protein
MKRLIKIIWWRMLLKVEITIPSKPNYFNYKCRTTFVFVPRKIPCTIYFFIIGIGIIFVHGIKGLKEAYKNLYEPISSSGFEFIDFIPYTPTKNECYAEF